MPNTYVALDTRTLGANADDITFSNIPASYTDLVLVIVAAEATANTNGLRVRVGNNTIDTGNNYSNTYLTGNGTSATSNRESNNSSIGAAWQTAPSGNVGENVTTFHFMNYSNTTTNKTILCRSNQAAQAVEATVGLWRSTVAINTILVRTSAGSANQLKAGSTFSLYGIANADQGAAKATGGIITEDSQYWYHTFGASGTFTPKQALTCDYLVIAGGGSGAGGSGGVGGGGGGAGGYRTSIGGSPLSLTAINYAVTVGAGGPSVNTNVTGNNGSNSVFSTITSTGGGGGGSATGNSGLSRPGNSGGSGGGGGTTGDGLNVDGGAGNTPSTSPSQGNNGGFGGTAAALPFRGGGGGGAGGVGATSAASGNGGDGLTSSISGTAVTRAGGGGAGGNAVAGVGGSGGGGTGSVGTLGTATPGVVNTGSGGGAHCGGASGSGAGGSGIVIIRYSK